MYDIVQHDHARELLARSSACLEKRESENNLPYGLAHTLARDPRYYGDEPPLLLSIEGKRKSGRRGGPNTAAQDRPEQVRPGYRSGHGPARWFPAR